MPNVRGSKKMKTIILILSVAVLSIFADGSTQSKEDKKLLAYADNSLNIEWYIPNDWKPLTVDIGINKNQPTWISKDGKGIIGLAKENRILSKEQIQEEERELSAVDKGFKAYDIQRSGRKWHIQDTKLKKMYTLHMITYLDDKTIRFTIISDDQSNNNKLMKIITGTFMYIP